MSGVVRMIILVPWGLSVVVGVVVGWVAGGGAPGGRGGVELWPGALVGVVVVCVAGGRSMCIAACGGVGRLG